MRQSRFDFGPLAVAPLWSINGVMGILRRDAEEVLDMILDGKLPWAWNIATQERRAEWRIWSNCVREYQLCNPRREEGADLPHSEVITQLLAHTRSVLRGSEIRSVWTCDRQTIQRHIQLGNLQLEEPNKTLRVNQTPRLTRESFEKFMYARCAKLCHASRRNHHTNGGTQ